MNLFDNPHFFPLQILRLLSLYSSVLVAGCEALVGWWRGFVLVGMLGGGGCCSRSLGFLWLYFMAWAFTVYWNYWASMAESSFGLVY
ncbi:unnamed protein product [Malus baccata var. baccata]